MEKIIGLIDAPFTPMKPNGDINLEPIPAYAAMLAKNGLKGVFINGSSGEGYMLMPDERKQLAEAWMAAVPAGFKVIVHVGSCCLRESVELARHAASIGAWGIGSMAPPFPKIGRIEELVKYCEAIAAAAPELPFYYYHIPAFNGAFLPMLDFLKAVDGRIPNFAGIKYTDENMMDFQLCLEFKNRKYNIMWGRDEMLLEALSIGADAFIGSTYGYMAPLYQAIARAFEAGDIKKAASLQFEAVRLITLLDKYGSGTGKGFMKAAGLDLGPCRRPLVTLEGERYEAFLQELPSTRFEEFKNSF